MPQPANPQQHLDSALTRRNFLETSAAIAGALGITVPAATQAADKKPSGEAAHAAVPHPLDPLTPDEIVAVGIVRQAKQVDEKWRIVTVTLAEPAKQVLRGLKPGGQFPRHAFVIAIDRSTGQPYDGIVDLATGKLDRFDPLPAGLQPSITLDEFAECEEAIKRSPEFLAALKKRGAANIELVMVDPWSAGMYGTERPDEAGLRLSRALAWVRSEANDNGYARPLDGVVAVVDLNKMQVLRIEDYGVIPLPPEAGNWYRSYQKEFREAPRPLEIAQTEGPSFTVTGYEVSWQKWSFRIGFTPRARALVLHAISYDDAGRRRPIIHRAALCEMVVPYGDPAERHFRKNAFDIGEYGIGMFANSLELGCDCLGTIRYFDAQMNDSRGQPVTIKNAVCLHMKRTWACWWKQQPIWAHRPVGNSPFAAAGSLVRGHRRQLRVRVFLVPVSGRNDPVRSQTDGDHAHDDRGPRRKTGFRHACRPTALRAVPRARLRRAARHERRRRRELDLRGEHRFASARRAQSPRQCLPRRADVAGQGIAGLQRRR